MHLVITRETGVTSIHLSTKDSRVSNIERNVSHISPKSASRQGSYQLVVDCTRASEGGTSPEDRPSYVEEEDYPNNSAVDAEITMGYGQNSVQRTSKSLTMGSRRPQLGERCTAWPTIPATKTLVRQRSLTSPPQMYMTTRREWAIVLPLLRGRASLTIRSQMPPC